MKTKEVKGVWSDDTLGREEDGKFVATFLRKRCKELADQGEKRSYVLNIDAQWGQGKTFFLERFQKQLHEAGHIAVYVNAWRDDFADDPLVAVMAAIDEEVAKHLKPNSQASKAWNIAKKSGGKVTWLVAKGLLKRGASLLLTAGTVDAIQSVAGEGSADLESAVSEEVSKAVTTESGVAIDELLDREGDAVVSDFASTKASIESFRKNLAMFVLEVEKIKGRSAPFFVLVDELDRCRPPYAIAMLERIKHLFETPNVAFVIATDSTQLVHSMSAIYGQEFEGQRYLKRFFDRTYVFEKPDSLRFVQFLLKTMPLDMEVLSSPFENKHETFISEFFNHAEADLRSIGQMYDILRTLVTTWDPKGPKLELLIMLPLIALFHKDHSKLLERKIRSDDLKHFFGSMRQQGHQYDRGRGTIAFFDTRDTFVQLWQIGESRRLDQQLNLGGAESTKTEWLRERVSVELRIRFPSGLRPSESQPCRSIMAEYPKMVRSAGRLTAIDGD